jgi:putative hemolysin
MNINWGDIMNRRQKGKLWLVWILLALLIFSGCAQQEQQTQPGPTASPGLRATDQALAARRAVLDFLREGANECVPPAGVSWKTTLGTAPQGFEVYLFESEGCFMSVANPLPVTRATNYHVALHNGVTGFCWQAHVDAGGQVVATGTRAEMPQELADAAAAYCLAQGYEHEVKEQADGTRCGVCTFADGRSCKAWAYYQGMCE